ncbi:hypothetical protein, partial [Nocardia brevicatena]|uniref:hypothetical protein n=1 Tax=Nocardia brevicatena TaxID=37327 RepID=UPI00278C3816
MQSVDQSVDTVRIVVDPLGDKDLSGFCGDRRDPVELFRDIDTHDNSHATLTRLGMRAVRPRSAGNALHSDGPQCL